MNSFKWTSLCGLTTAMALMAGCSQSDSGDTVAQNEPMTPQQTEAPSTMNDQQTGETVTAQKVIDEAGETMHKAQELAQQTKDEYVRELNEQLTEFDQKMNDLQQRTGQLTDKAKAEWQKSRDNLQKRREQIKQQIDELQSASGDAWRDLREGTGTAWEELRQAFDKASQHFETGNTHDDAAAKTPPGEEATAVDPKQEG